MVNCLLYKCMLIICSLYWFWRCKEHPRPLNPDLGGLIILEVCDWGFGSWTWFGYIHLPLKHQWFKFWLSSLILKMLRTSVSFNSWCWALKEAWGSWLEILILILIWSVLLFTSIIHILDLYLSFEGAKNIYALWVPVWGFGGCWRFLTGFLDFDLDKNQRSLINLCYKF